jgi:hypothetical protein
MSESSAASHFAGREYEILRETVERRVVGGDPLEGSMAHLQVKAK